MVKKIKEKGTKKSTIPKITESSPEPIIQECIVQEAIVNQVTSATKVDLLDESDNISAVSNIFETLIQQNENMLNTQRLITQLLKKTLKSYERDRKDYERNLARDRRKAKKDPSRKKRDPSGFAVATDISDNLCDFLSIEKGSKLSRTDVTRKVTAYIREQNLQVPANRRSFIPDEQLGSILGPLKDIDKDKGFTYFNLQRYITPHITSSASSASS
jgi:chromatin remodeling complex protein RSC6